MGVKYELEIEKAVLAAETQRCTTGSPATAGVSGNDQEPAAERRCVGLQVQAGQAIYSFMPGAIQNSFVATAHPVCNDRGQYLSSTFSPI